MKKLQSPLTKGFKNAYASRFHTLLNNPIETLCPTKIVYFSALDNGKPLFPKVQKLFRGKMSFYTKKGNCQEYKDIKKTET